jgi:capsular exopolysaccharide family
MQDQIETFNESTPTVSLREYGDILRRRRAIILQTFVIVLVIGVLYTLFTAPTYQTKARLLVEPQGSGLTISNGTNPLDELFRLRQQYSLGTQIELLQAPELRKKVAERTGASSMPRMTIEGLEGTTIISITSEGEDPESVAAAPNVLMEAYIEKITKDRGGQVGKAIEFAESKAKNANERMRRAEAELQSFKQKNNVAELVENRRAAISAADQAKAQYSSLLAAIAGVKTRMARSQEEIDRLVRSGKATVSDVVSSAGDPRVQALETQINGVEAQLVGLKEELRESNPKMVALRKQLHRLYDDLANARKSFFSRTERKNPMVTKLQDSLIDQEVELSVLNQQLAAAQAAVQAAQERLIKFPSFEIRLSQLERERDVAKTDYENYRSRLADLYLKQQTEPKLASILDRAQVPTSPIRPKKAQNIIFAGLLGLFLGLGLALLMELIDDRMNSAEEAERVLRLPTLGTIPLIEEEGLRLIRDISTFSPLMESYRTLRTNINFAAVGNTVKSLLVTSSVPAEGKSTTCANLAMAMAMDGRRVIIVDGDLRRPSQHHLFKINSSPGLTDILVGTHTIEEVMQPTSVEGVRIIPAGSPPPNPAELLGSDAMGAFLAAVEQMADVVLLDSPPTLAVADAAVLSSRTDGVLLVISYGETKKSNTKQAREMLGRANALVLGTVLNRQDAPGGGYYYGYGKYYVPATDPIALATPQKNGNGTHENGTGAAATEVTDLAPDTAARRDAE